MKETLRPFPPAPAILRILTKAVVMDGVEIPAGTRVCVSMMLMHRNPELYPEPDKFDPERFNKDNSQDRVLLSMLLSLLDPETVLDKMLLPMRSRY